MWTKHSFRAEPAQIVESVVKILLTETEVQAGVRRLADWIRETYDQRPLTIVSILTGSLVLVADLMRELTMPLRVALVQASSYRGQTTSPQSLKIDFRLLPDLTGREVLVIDDIFDTGQTLKEVLEHVRTRNPAQVRSAVLLRKNREGALQSKPDYIVFEIPNVFVVGYGLDYDDLYRNLPYVAALDADALLGDT